MAVIRRVGFHRAEGNGPAAGRGRGRFRALAPVAVCGVALLLLAGCQTLQATKSAEETQPSNSAPLPPAAEPLPEAAPLPSGPADGRTRVALLAPMSGSHAQLGQALANAAQLALFDVGGDDFVLLVKDTGGSAAGAQAAARGAMDEGARLLLGPLFSSLAAAVKPEAAARGVPVLTFSNDRSIAGDGLYVLGVSPRAQVVRVVEHAVRAEGLRRFGVIAPNSPYGNAVIEAMQAAANDNQAEITKVATYSPGSPDLSEPVQRLADYQSRRAALLDRRRQLTSADDEASKQALTRLRGLDTLGPPAFEALMIPAGGGELLQLASLLPYYDVDPAEVRFLGTLQWDDASLGTEPALVGGRFAAPPPQSWELFRKRYREVYGQDPHRLASLAYDGTALAAVLLREAEAAPQAAPQAIPGQALAETVEPVGDGSGPVAAPAREQGPYTAQALTRPSGFAGVDGIFRLRPDGEVERGLAVLELRRGSIKVVEPAPTSFEPLVF